MKTRSSAVIFGGLVAALGSAKAIAPSPAERCTEIRVSSEWEALELPEMGGRPLYVEPSALVDSEPGGVLLAGMPSALWYLRDVDGEVTVMADTAAFLGVVIRRDGSLRMVERPELPFGVRTEVLRAQRSGPGGWRVVGLGTDSVGGMTGWSAEYTEAGWGPLSWLPSLAPSQPSLEGATELVRTRGGYAMAVPTEFPEVGRFIALLRLTRARWEADILPIPRTAAVALAYVEPHGLLMAVTRPDPTVEADRNSLFLYMESHQWQRPRRLVLGANRPVHHQTWSPERGAAGIAWETIVQERRGQGNTAMAIVDVFEADPIDVVLLGHNVEHVVTLGRWQSVPLWLLARHFDGGRERRLHLITISENGEPTLLHEAPNVFEGPVQAAWTSRNTIMISAGTRTTLGEDTIVESRLMRLRLDCRG